VITAKTNYSFKKINMFNGFVDFMKVKVGYAMM
jgi:hypothetical protein